MTTVDLGMPAEGPIADAIAPRWRRTARSRPS